MESRVGIEGSGFGVQVLRFGVQGLRFRRKGPGYIRRVWDFFVFLGFRA